MSPKAQKQGYVSQARDFVGRANAEAKRKKKEKIQAETQKDCFSANKGRWLSFAQEQKKLREEDAAGGASRGRLL